MAEFGPGEELAVLYVRGELTAAEARAFEERLESAPELVAHVRDLEEGAVALALACPQKRPPQQIWTNIERAVKGERRIVPWREWLRNKGWAAAAACLVGWVGYALVVPRDAAEQPRQSVRGQSHQHEMGAVSAIVKGSIERVTNGVAAGVSQTSSPAARGDELEMRGEEAEQLRRRVAELQRETFAISQALTQQQALLNEPGRVKMFRMTPVSSGPTNSNAALSPELRRALAIAMARELGWLAPSNRVGMPVNIEGVDFVDLQSATSMAAPLLEQPQTQFAQNLELDPGVAHEEEKDPSSAPSSLPGYTSGGTVTVAMDNSVAPAGSFVAFSASSGSEAQALGTVTMGPNPFVITFTPRFTSTDGMVITIHAVSPAGASNSLQFIAAP